jgi:hypothetical protein
MMEETTDARRPKGRGARTRVVNLTKGGRGWGKSGSSGRGAIISAFKCPYVGRNLKRLGKNKNLTPVFFF